MVCMKNTRAYPPGVLERLQEVELGLLDALDTLCRDNGIDYFVEGGTCLGAVRHGGFIPWDDDVDVSMPLDSYRRFLDIAPRALPDGMSLHVAENTHGFSALWAKVFADGTKFVDEVSREAGCDQGIFIDVFPYVRLDSDPQVAERQRRDALFCQRMSYLHFMAHPKIPRDASLRPLKVLACVAAHATVARPWGPAKLRARFERCFETPNPSDVWFDPCYADWGSFAHDVLFPTTDIAFQGLTLRAPAQTDAYLTTLYGDWHYVPPEEDRYTHLPLELDFGDGLGNVM